MNRKRRNHMGLTPSRFWFLFVLSISLVYGQVDRSNLNGTVTDPSGALIEGARVQIVSRETGLTRDVRTGSSGVYNITGLPIGTYDLTISHEGFQTSTVREIQLFVGQTRTVDAAL